MPLPWECRTAGCLPGPSMPTLPHRTSKGDAGLCATEVEWGTIFGEARVVVYTQRGRMQGVSSQVTAGA